ncbi:hydrolase [Pseudoflavitalea sp. G-6-1-2]|uniref:SGNH/GDSL hydrolase family protein n=1 Tax=Pseudoflavitalea sp. G-6-1-2 TaxID=2728841 RepID=UPI00146CAEB6|nr:SGNH/GDSL hydrolase family protein [Pseudoflavitalea sp. G-6-1-2]NML20247.1 hydrolase [Pseudoflavitalea sp. G-6-1-2]
MKTPALKTLIAVNMLLLCVNAFAQNNIRYVKAETLTLIGKAKKTDSCFQRIDSAEAAPMPMAVRSLAKQSAGIAVLFETNSTTIRAKWKLSGEVYLSNMTPIAHSGLDLYCFRNNKWQYVNVGKPAKGIDQEQRIIENMDNSTKQFMIYLPLYNSINDLQIGVEENAIIKSPAHAAVDTTLRVVVYGSSIVQGASASRPGMAYPAILQRRTGYDVINLGFSGNAKMEKELAEYLATVPADCYVLDCIPNPSPEEINERSYPFIKLLCGKKPNTPIILVETVFRENGNWDQKVGQRITRQNEEIRKTYNRLIKEGVKNIYYIETTKLIGNDHEATVDGVHLSDLGFTRIADALLPLIEQAMKKHK